MFKTNRTVESMSYKQKALLVAGIFLCMELGLMVSMEFSIALPSIISDIGGAEFYALIFTVNLAVSAIVTPFVGKLSDVYGRRQILIIGILIILVSEVITPLLVSNVYHLMIFRGIQGIGGATTAVVALIVISDIFDIENRAKFLGFYGSLNALTAIVAPTVGGIFVQYFSWHWVFYSIAPVGLIGLILILKLMPNIPKVENAKMDYVGASILSVAILSLVGLTSFGSSTVTPILLVVLAVSLTAFIISQKKSTDPLIPLRLFKHRIFTICILASMACMFAATGLIYFLPLFLQNIHGFSPTETGIFMTERGITSFIFAAISGFIVAKLKDFKLVAIVAMCIFASAIFALTFFTVSAPTIIITAIFLVWGSSSGVLISIFHTGIQMNLPTREISVAMSVMQLAVSMGALLATSLLGMFVQTASLSQGFSYLLYTCLAVVIVTLLAFVILVPKKKHVVASMSAELEKNIPES